MIQKITAESKNAKAAIALANQFGFQILPIWWINTNGSCACGNKSCRSVGKHPIAKAVPAGLKDATADIDTIRGWWDRFPQANIAVRTGSGSGIWVLDLDGEAGISALDKLTSNRVLPATPSANTGGGGKHLYFGYPDDRDITNRTRLGGLPIDCRGDGGYVLAPPSNHASGNGYTWETAPRDCPVAPAPDWLIDEVTGRNNGTPDDDIAITFNGDLATHPGAVEGDRNTVLCRLVGKHLNQHGPDNDLLPQALAWAARCRPPLPEDQVRRAVISLAEKHTRQSQQGLFTLNTFITYPKWPNSIDQAAYHGLVGDVVRLIEPHSESDPVALLVQFLAAFGNAVGRAPFFQVESDRHYMKLFIVLVGKTAKGRKGTSAGRVLNVFQLVDESWVQEHIAHGLSSGEGLIWAVRDEVRKKKAYKEQGQINYHEVINDEGILDKRLLVFESEFAQCLKVMNREGNTLSPTIRSAWDTGNLQTLTKNSPTKATGAHVSIIGHITEDELRRHLTETETSNGFANRFLFCCVERSKFLAEGGNLRSDDFEPYACRLRDALEYGRTVERMAFDETTRRLWHAVYPELSSGAPGLFGAITSRAEAQTVRLACIYALLDQSVIIRQPHLEAALAVWSYAEDSARHVFGDATGDPVADQILAALRSSPDGLTRTEIYRLLKGNVPRPAIASALQVLESNRLAHKRVEQSGGRPVETWFAGRAGTDW